MEKDGMILDFVRRSVDESFSVERSKIEERMDDAQSATDDMAPQVEVGKEDITIEMKSTLRPTGTGSLIFLFSLCLGRDS